MQEVLQEHTTESVNVEFGKARIHVSDPSARDTFAMLYSMAETAKAYRLRPYEYFKYVLESMLQHMDDSPESYINELMPWSESIPEEIWEYWFYHSAAQHGRHIVIPPHE